MSEKRSWDVTPNARKKVGAQQTQRDVSVRKPSSPTGQRRVLNDMQTNVRPPARRTNPQTEPVQTVTRRPSPRRVALQPAGALRQKRKRHRMVMRYVASFVLLGLIGAAFYAVWLPSLRIHQVSVSGPGAPAAQQIAEMSIAGSYFRIVPKNSIFFFPVSKIRASILDAIPEANAVSISRSTFSSITVTTTPRAVSFLWCGTDIQIPTPYGYCYDADSQGLIFKEDISSTDGIVEPQDGSTTATMSSDIASTTHPANGEQNARSGIIRVYGAVDRDVSNGQSPLRAVVVSPSPIVTVLKFVAAIRELHVPISTLVIRGDEADLLVTKKTRITYVIGHEQEAASLAASALPSLNLTDGSIEYVDLRFPGKAYSKKYETAPQ